ncbi:hypothetical protein LDJ79_06760 [Vibrio tritonius]|uniref:Uncharacterized protein n=1 Tax=Vibrio tritonius TaxID=1435069 RepID=A0ABS7YJE9_9VIBR|nr:hypothetical protein [Vibrio tritonius]MCA2015805.1 hypothetical protein [Vibrio tritonius]
MKHCPKCCFYIFIAPFSDLNHEYVAIEYSYALLVSFKAWQSHNDKITDEELAKELKIASVNLCTKG